jgi:hypothetical protein
MRRGPVGPSTRILQRRRSAVAGSDDVLLRGRQQHVALQEQRLFAVDVFASEKPVIEPVSLRCFINPITSMPCGLYTAPSHSITEMILNPARAINFAAIPPTLPKP